jgi:hypothetical protein
MTARVGVGVLGLALLAMLIALVMSSWSQRSAVAAASDQPIHFPHNVHVQQYKIDCQYCHANARRSTAAGLPSVSRCMGCHQITAADKPEIKKLADYAARGEPIPWVRVYKLPEFTYFSHKAHVAAGVRCQTCHGPVETMTAVGAVTGPRLTNDLLHLVGLRPAPPPLSMGWCVDCHRKANAADPTHHDGRRVQAPLDCVTCHH